MGIVCSRNVYFLRLRGFFFFASSREFCKYWEKLTEKVCLEEKLRTPPLGIFDNIHNTQTFIYCRSELVVFDCGVSSVRIDNYPVTFPSWWTDVLKSLCWLYFFFLFFSWLKPVRDTGYSRLLIWSRFLFVKHRHRGVLSHSQRLCLSKRFSEPLCRQDFPS